MRIVLAYDITDDARRTELAAKLKNYGQRVQKSVFEFDLEADQIAELRKEAEKIADISEDNLRYYFLCKKDEVRVEHIGASVIYRDEDYFMI
jgi:CRISPR-associated protein Cas2